MMRFPCVASLIFLFAAPALAQPTAPAPPPAKCTSGPARLVPVMSTRTRPRYPAESSRLREQGTLEMIVEVLPGGAAGMVTVRKSSGSPRLDDAGVAHVKSTWRWEPTGCVHALGQIVRVEFAMRPQVPNEMALAFADATHWVNAKAADYPSGMKPVRALVMVGIVLSPDGQVRIQMTRTLSGPQNSALEEKSRQIVRGHKWSPVTLDGTRVSSIIQVAMVWTPPGEKPPNTDALKAMMSKALQAAPP